MNQAIVLVFFLISIFIINNSTGTILRNECGVGWDLPAYNLFTKQEYCYKFKYDEGKTLNWLEALRYCKQNEGGELLHVENANESVWLWKVFTDPTIDRTEIHLKDQIAEGWFINAHRELYNSSGPAWSDGRPLADLQGVFHGSVEQGQTVVSYATLDNSCYYMNISSGNIRSTVCDTKITKLGYICKKERYASAAQKFRVCTHKEAKNITCPDEWVEPENKSLTSGSYCYKLGPVISTWDSAYYMCKAQGGELAFVESTYETAWIKTLASKASARGVFIGYHKYFYGPAFMFSNGIEIGNSGFEWVTEAPENKQDENCGSVTVARSMKLDDCGCSLSYNYQYICKKPKCLLDDNQPSTTSCDCSGIKANTTSSLQNSYFKMVTSQGNMAFLCQCKAF